MLCSDFHARLQDVLDRRQKPELDSRLRGHAARCPACHSEWVAWNQVIDGLECAEIPELPDDFAQRVVNSLPTGTLPSPATGRRRNAPLWAAALAVAASLLLVAIPLARQWSQPASIAQPASPPITGSPTATSLAQQTVPAAIDPGGEDAVGEPWLVSSSILEFYPEETRERHRQQVYQIAGDLRPITTPFNAALSAIRRSIPVKSSESKGPPAASLDPTLHSRHLS